MNPFCTVHLKWSVNMDILKQPALDKMPLKVSILILSVLVPIQYTAYTKGLDF